VNTAAVNTPVMNAPAADASAATPILSLRGIRKQFSQSPDLAARIAGMLGAATPPSVVKAVDGIDLDILPGEVVGVVGESGCGKSTLGRMIAGINPPSAGDIHYLGKSVAGMDNKTRRAFELDVQMIFQNPMASLNPRMRVEDIIGEAPVVHGLIKRGEQAQYVAGLMRQVGLDPSYAQRYPHQFSGGQRQRIGIARALALKPKVIVCDEAVAALDVSIQAQILNLLKELQETLGLTMLFISHDLPVIRQMCDRVGVMRYGELLEVADTETLFTRPQHEYSKHLLGLMPQLGGMSRAGLEVVAA